ncbi:MAG: MFS transporter [Dermabacter sp.]|nr:MFS transporter [Dermabacter sp.]
MGDALRAFSKGHSVADDSLAKGEEQNERATTPLLRDRAYLAWMVGDTASAFGMGLTFFATPLLAVLVTGSASQAGIVAAAASVGGVVGLLPGGVLADRFDRKSLRAWSAISGAAICAAIVLLLFFSWLDGPTLAVLGFLLQLRGSLFGPASDAILRAVVGKERMSRAVVANQARDSAVAIASGPAGGALYAIAPIVPFIVNTAAFVLFWITNRGLSSSKPRGQMKPGAVWTDFGEGVTYVVRAPLLRSGVITFSLLNLATSGVVMTMILHLQISGASPQQIGLINLVVGVGALLGALMANPVISRVRSGIILMVGVLLIASSMVGVALSPSFTVGLAVFAVALLAGPAVNATVGGLLMYVIPDEILGRVMSVLYFCTGALMPLSPAIAGVGLDTLGYRGTLFVFAGVAGLAAIVALSSRALRQLPASGQWHTVSL